MKLPSGSITRAPISRSRFAIPWAADPAWPVHAGVERGHGSLAEGGGVEPIEVGALLGRHPVTLGGAAHHQQVHVGLEDGGRLLDRQDLDRTALAQHVADRLGHPLRVSLVRDVDDEALHRSSSIRSDGRSVRRAKEPA
jgi:hypothetical protein